MKKLTSNLNLGHNANFKRKKSQNLHLTFTFEKYFDKTINIKTWVHYCTILFNSELIKAYLEKMKTNLITFL